MSNVLLFYKNNFLLFIIFFVKAKNLFKPIIYIILASIPKINCLKFYIIIAMKRTYSFNNIRKKDLFNGLYYNLYIFTGQ